MQTETTIRINYIEPDQYLICFDECEQIRVRFGRFGEIEEIESDFSIDDAFLYSLIEFSQTR